MRWLAALALATAPAAAQTHVVERGETLERVARAYGCSTDAVLRANRLDTTLVPAGTRVTIPACKPPRAPVRPTAGNDDDRARRALAVIDDRRGPQPARRDAAPSATASPRDLRASAERIGPAGGIVPALPADRCAIDRGEDEPHGESVGQPWNGKLVHATLLPRGEGYRIRRPAAAFGAEHVVGHLRRVIAEVRALHPGVHELAIGDLSAEHGGPLDRHRSHQSGLDVDVGFYFTTPPRGYPDDFVTANRALDLEATWALLTAFARTADLSTGVQIIFLDYDVQARLYRWARARGTPDDELAVLLQYPRGKDTLVGLVRHWPSHDDHMHVRFRAGP